jgi:hypothetical protein
METKTPTLLVSAVVAVVIQEGLDSGEEMNMIRTTINNKVVMTLIGRDKNSMVDCLIVQEVEDEDVHYFRCSISELGLTENIWCSI